MSAYNTLCAARTAVCSACVAGLLSSCTSPPKPPSVDDSNKRPLNAKVSVELQSCRGELSRAQIVLAESARSAPLAAGFASAKRDCAGDASEGGMDPSLNKTLSAHPNSRDTGNYVVIVPFRLGSVAWGLSQADADALARRAAAASMVMIRGRTDSPGDSPSETALARQRAEVAAAFFAAAGTPKDKMRLTWQGSGDSLAGLSARERGQNRRVEIEFYNVAPVAFSVRNDSKVQPDPRGSDTAASL